MKILYHGSPIFMNEIHSNTPRGDDIFDSKKGIYMTSNFMEACLYSIARDKEKNNRSWGVKYIRNQPFLILKSEKWKGINKKYTLNKIGYVYEYKAIKYAQNKKIGRETEHRIDKDKIIPNIIYFINP